MRTQVLDKCHIFRDIRANVNAIAIFTRFFRLTCHIQSEFVAELDLIRLFTRVVNNYLEAIITFEIIQDFVICIHFESSLISKHLLFILDFVTFATDPDQFNDAVFFGFECYVELSDEENFRRQVNFEWLSI